MILGSGNRKNPSHILIVDSSVGDRLATEHALESSGYRSDSVSDCQEAIEAMSAFVYNLVLISFDLPAEACLDAYSKIRRTGLKVYRSKLPLIGLANNKSTFNTYNIIKGDVECPLVKPSDIYELTSTIESYI